MIILNLFIDLSNKISNLRSSLCNVVWKNFEIEKEMNRPISEVTSRDFAKWRTSIKTNRIICVRGPIWR